MRHCQW